MCAEPGMGKTYLAMRLMDRAADAGWKTFCYQCEQHAHGAACNHMVRMSRNVLKKVKNGEEALVIFDGVAPADEGEAVREANAIAKLQAAGCQVVVCIRPEAEQLLECLTSYRCLRVEDLLYKTAMVSADIEHLTGGIPALMAALQPDSAGSYAEPAYHAYLGALSRLLDQTLRPYLPQEEQRARLAIALLGQGTLDELALVSGRCDVEMLSWLQRDVTLFGIDTHLRTFSCCGIDDDERFLACAGILHARAASYPKVVARACGVLAARGDVRRSSIVCSLCSSEIDFASVGVSWGVAYVLAGEVTLAEEALQTARSKGMWESACTTMTSAAVASLTATSQELDAEVEAIESLVVNSQRERRLYHDALLLIACRDAWRNPRKAIAHLGVEPDDTVGMSCIEHLRVGRLMAAGRFADAYALMTNEMIVGEACSIPDALLCDDLRFVLLMAGGVPDARERELFGSSRRFFARTSLGRLQTYHLAFEQIPYILMGTGTEASALDDAAVRAERAGDMFARAVFLFVLSVRDLRARAYQRAHVRAEHAVTMAKTLGESYLTSSAELVDALVSELLEERGALVHYCEDDSRPRELFVLARIAVQVSGEAKDGGLDHLYEIPLTMKVPRDSLWALNVLLRDCGSLSQRMVAAVPPQWSEAVRAVHARQAGLWHPSDERERIGDARHAGARADLTFGEGEQMQMLPVAAQDTRIRISILGGFAVSVQGETVPEGPFDRRRARDLLMLLALVPGHRLRRYQIVEALWSNVDYYRAPRRVYEATGEARRHLIRYAGGANPIISEKAQGLVALDQAMVSCDIDDFEREARLTLMDDGDDFWVLDHARAMQDLYKSGPDEHLTTMGERVCNRVQEVITLYVDALVAAGEAALRLGRAKLAVRYATDAHQLRDLREDAFILLVQALRASGRSYEVGSLYRQFSRHLMEVEGTPPSLALRRAAAQAIGDGPDLLQQ